MFKKYENEHLRAQVAVERHVTIRIVGGALCALLLFATLITSVTYYNVKSLEVPVKYEENHNYEYERGSNEGEE